MKVSYKKIWVLCAEQEISKAEKTCRFSAGNIYKAAEEPGSQSISSLENSSCSQLQRR